MPGRLMVVSPAGVWVPALPDAGQVFEPPGPVFNAFAIGDVKPIGRFDPGERNVGCRIDDADLEVLNGNLTLQSGGVYEGLDIRGKVTANSSALGTPPIVRDCIVRGPLPSGAQDNSARGAAGNFADTLFEWVTFDRSGRESPFSSTIEGGRYRMRYCELMRSVDGIGANAVGNGIVEGCRIYKGHYFAWWDDVAGAPRNSTFTDFGGTTRPAPFPGQSSGDVHGDGIQIQRGTGWVIRGNAVGGPRGYTLGGWSQIDPTKESDYAIMTALDADLGFPNACLMINGYSAEPVGALIEKNWFSGGAARVNLAAAGSDTLAGVTVRNNRFDRMTAAAPNLTITGSGMAGASISGNVYSDNNSPI